MSRKPRKAVAMIRWSLAFFLAVTVLGLPVPASADEPSSHEKYLLAVICAKTRCVQNPTTELPPGVIQYLDSIWVPLLRASRIPASETTHLYLTYAPDPNAWAIKHYWGITAGLWNLRLTRDEMAFVAAHELSHMELGHYEQKLNEIAKIYAVAIIAVIISRGNYNPLNDPYFVTVARLGLAAYSREHETQADLRGIQLMQAAGFDPKASITALQKIAPLGVSGAGDLFDSHPSVEQRVARLQRDLPAPVLPLPQPAPSTQPDPSPAPAPPTLPEPSPSSTLPPPPSPTPRATSTVQAPLVRQTQSIPKVRVIRAVGDDGESGNVLIGNVVVLRIKTSFEGKNPFQRADEVAERLSRLLSNGLTPEDVKRGRLAGQFVIYGRGEVLLTIDAELARRNGTTAAILALRWVKVIQGAISRLK